MQGELMLPGRMDPKKMQGLMRQMGIKSKQINAEEVVIKTDSGRILISNPQVTEITMQGIKTYQIAGEIKEEKGTSEEDIGMIAEKTGCSKEEARKALEENDGDLAAAILSFQE